MELGQGIHKRYEKLWSRDANWRAGWQELADFVLPRVSNIIAKTTSGEKLTTKLYDAEGVKANHDLASALAGSMTSPVIRWFTLAARDERVNEMVEVRRWLDAVESSIYLALQQSNFSSQMAEFYLYLSCFGTATVQVEEKAGKTPGFRGVQFKTLPVASYVIGENAESEVDTIITKFELPYGAAVKTWGLGALSEKAQTKAAADPDGMLVMLHAVYPEDDDPKLIRLGKPFKSCYVEFETKHVVAEDGFYEFPYTCVRWAKDASEVWGRGPGHIALPDIKTLNTAVRLRLKSWAKQVDPPMLMLDEGVLGQPRFTPGSLNIGRSKDALTPIGNAARIDFAIQQEERVSAKIRNVFFADRIALPSKQYMTAYEVQALREQMQALLGPTTGRIEYEGLTPLLARVFGIMVRARVFSPPPRALLELGTPIDIRYEGPLARAQRSGNIAGIQTTLNTIAPITQLDPSVIDNFDLDETAREIGRDAGLPAKLLRDKDAVAERRQARAQAQQAAQEQADQLNQSQIARNLTPAARAAQEAEDDSGFAPVGGE